MKIILFLLFYSQQCLAANEHLTSEVYDATLNNPNTLLKIMFPKMDSFKVYSISRGNNFYKEKASENTALIIHSLGSPLDPTYEAIDTQYLFYEIYDASKKYIGLVTGCNVKTPTGIQEIFVAITSTAQIQDVYVQSISGSHTEINRKMFQALDYRKQFQNLSVKTVLDDSTIEALASPPGVLASRPVVYTHLSVMRAIRLSLLIYEQLYTIFKSKLENAHGSSNI